MIISNAQWVDNDRAVVNAIIDGKTLFVPASPLNRHFAEIIRQEIPIADPPSDA